VVIFCLFGEKPPLYQVKPKCARSVISPMLNMDCDSAEVIHYRRLLYFVMFPVWTKNANRTLFCMVQDTNIKEETAREHPSRLLAWDCLCWLHKNLLTRAVIDCIPLPRRIWSGSGVHIWKGIQTYRSRWLPKFNGDFLVRSYISGKIFMKIQSLCPVIWAKLCKNAHLAMLKNPFKNSWILIRKWMTSKI